MRKLAVALVFLCAAPLAAQFSERIDVVVVEVPIKVRDRDGKVPPNLTKNDFEVYEDRKKQEVIGVTYPVAQVPVADAAGGAIAPIPVAERQQRWQIVVFVQESFSSTVGLRMALKGLIPEVERLAAMGDVEIVSDYPSPHVILPPTGDVDVLRQAVTNLREHAIGQQEIVRARADFDRDKEHLRRLKPEQRIPAVNAAAQFEVFTVRKRMELMQSWMTRYAAGNGNTRRLLLYVSDGYPLEPVNFYLIGIPDGEMLSTLRGLSSVPQQGDLAKSIAAQGWTVYGVVPGAMYQAAGKTITEMSATDFGEEMSTRGSAGEAFLALKMLSAETGGSLVTDVRRIGSDVGMLTERVTLSYRANHRADGKPHHLQVVTTRPGLSIEAPLWVMSNSPEGVAAARATALALDFGEQGELPVRCTIHPGSGRGEEVLELAVDFAPFAAARATMKASTLRVAMGVAPDRKMPFTSVQNFPDIDLAAMPGWTATIPMHNRGGAPAAVVVEETATGAWGGARCGR